MKAIEFAKGSSRALNITLAPGSFDGLASELRLAKEALVEWKQRWGAHCDVVMFTIAVAPDHHPAVEAEIGRLRTEEVDLAPIRQSVDLRLHLLNERAKPTKEVSFPRAPKKPWWRLW